MKLLDAAVVVITMAALVLATSASADVAAGRQKAGTCAVCHGPLGIASAPDAPNLAGQSAIYLTAQLRAYRAGTRQHEVMSVIAKPLSDGDIDDLAAWFSSLKVQVQPPG